MTLARKGLSSEKIPCSFDIDSGGDELDRAVMPVSCTVVLPPDVTAKLVPGAYVLRAECVPANIWKGVVEKETKIENKKEKKGNIYKKPIVVEERFRLTKGRRKNNIARLRATITIEQLALVQGL